MATTLSILIIAAMSLIVVYLLVSIYDSFIKLPVRKEKSDKPNQFPGHRNPPPTPERPLNTEFSVDKFLKRQAEEILDAILTLKSAIDLSTTNEIAKEVERLQEAKEKKEKKTQYEIVKLNGKKYEMVPTKSEACWGDDGEVCALFEYCLSIPPHSVCDGCILREIKEKEEKS